MLKLLAIEDNGRDLELLRWRLAPFFALHTARTFREAVLYLARESFDAILLDVGLPDADRDKVVETVKAQCAGAAVIVLSGCEDTEYMRRVIQQSASNYLVKGRDDLSGEVLACHIRTGIKLNLSCRRLDEQIEQAQGAPVPAQGWEWLASPT